MKTCIFILFSLLSSVFADSLYLSNNNVVKGTIISMDGNVVKIETTNGILEVDKKSIVRGEFFGDGNELSGNLVIEFQFEGSIKDSSGSGYPVKTKSIPYTTGVLNNENSAIESKGTGQYFYIENSKTISSIEEFTIAMNILPTNTSENSFLVSNWENTFENFKAEGRFSLSIYKSSLAFFVVDTNGYYHTLGATDVINLNKWNSIAIRFSAGELSIYVNGTTVAQNSIKAETLLKGEWPIYFLTAKYGKDFKKYNFNGKLDNFKMFDSILSDNELDLLY